MIKAVNTVSACPANAALRDRFEEAPLWRADRVQVRCSIDDRLG